jgi:pilus assembly protein CpaE
LSLGRTKTLIVFDHSIDVELVRGALPAGGQVRAVALAQGVEYALAALTESPPDLLIVGSSGASDGVLELIRTARQRYEECVIVALHGESPNGFMERAFQNGVDDLITMPQSRESLSFALEKALARRRGSGQTNAQAPIICIIGPKGGTGKTLTACNLAVALGLAGKRPALVDIDLQFGDVGLALGLQPERTIYDLAIAGGSLDEEKVERFLVHHSSGADVLLAPIRPDQAGAIEIDFLRELYTTLRSHHDYVIVDTPPAFTPEVIATIDMSTYLCVVGMLDALSLKDTKIGLETLELMGIDQDRFRLVLNRADTDVGISQSDVERILGRRPDVLVPSDRAIPRSITSAVPIVLANQKSGAAQAFTSLAAFYLDQAQPGAAELGPAQEPAARPARRSLLRKGR